MESRLISGPHAHAPTSVGQIMQRVMVALLPATVFGICIYGWPALYLLTVTLAAALFAEALCLAIAGKPLRPYLTDGSAIVTAWLLAMTLPPWAPWWIGVTGAFIAIVIGKQVFGGIGQNLFNPAMVARVSLLVAFPLEMTAFIKPVPLTDRAAPGLLQSLQITFGHPPTLDAVSGATVLSHVKAELARGVSVESALEPVFDTTTALVGYMPGSLGETSAVLIALGGAFLLLRRVITWHIPVAMLGTLALLATIFHWLNPGEYAGPMVHLFSGAAVFGAFFIATDLVTSPVTVKGQLLFGAGTGALVFIIRSWAGYPEGMGFAIMLMNACTPLIDHYIRPRVYGRDRHGQPLLSEQKSGAAK
ncbi:MAG: RnfABCDGE type electron transport complex subunit D [Pseudomonadota bacterium]|nr:RnfABCDGE type electron transport complex subunit D [Pseudomonadota bacterium]